MNKKKTGLVLSLLGIISLVLITAGVTYAFFSYAKEGTTENVITTGTITFIYEEVEKNGAGISIEDAYPMADSVGKAQSGAGKVFNFSVKSETASTAQIPYTVTARMKSDSTLDQEVVRIYLTEVDGTTESQLLLDNYNNLTQTSVNVPQGTVEKVIHTDTVPAGTTDYEKNFRLRMWIDEDTNFSQNSDGTYPYNGKTFTVTVNVYANAEVVNVTTPSTPTYTSYNIGDAVTAVDGSKWHVLEASNENTETVVLLSDYNLNSDGSYNTECGSDINSNYKCSTMTFDSDGTNIYDINDNNNIGYFIKNTYNPLVTAALPGTTNVTLPTADQIAIADGKTLGNSSITLTSSWLLTTNYWTRTSTTDNLSVWIVESDYSELTGLDAVYLDITGARPVITTPKTNLLAE